MEEWDEGKNVYYIVLELKNKYHIKVYHLAKSVLRICNSFESAVNSCDNNQNRKSLEKTKSLQLKKRQFWLPSLSVCQRTNIPHCTYSAILPISVLNIVNDRTLTISAAHYFTDQEANNFIFLYVIYFYFSLIMVIFLKYIKTIIVEKSI